MISSSTKVTFIFLYVSIEKKSLMNYSFKFRTLKYSRTFNIRRTWNPNSINDSNKYLLFLIFDNDRVNSIINRFELIIRQNETRYGI